MAIFNVVQARRDGYSEKDIADYLASEADFNAYAARKDGYTDRDIIEHLNTQNMSMIDSFLAGAKAEVFSEIDGAKQLLGMELSNEQIARENLARQSEAENPWSTAVGRILGGFVNPSTLLPGSMLFKGAKGVAAAGAIGGGISGAVQPTYTEEDSRALQAGMGFVGGGVLGGALGKLFDPNASKAVPSASEAVDPTKSTVNLAGGVADVPNGSVAVPEVKIETVPVGTVKTASDNQDYEFFGQQWVSKQTGRVASKEIADELNPKPQFAPLQTGTQEASGQAVSNFFDVAELPQLPGYLRLRPPKFGGTDVVFETPIDNALYDLGRKGTSKQTREQLLNYVSGALNITKLQTAKLARDVAQEVEAKGMRVLDTAAKAGEQAQPIAFRLSKAVDNIVNPIEKHLDDESKVVYNYGKSFKDDMDVKAKIEEAKANGVSDIYNKVNPNGNEASMIADIQAYTKLLQASKSQKGRAFTARSFDDVLKNRHKNNDMFFDLVEEGNLDGC